MTTQEELQKLIQEIHDTPADKLYLKFETTAHIAALFVSLGTEYVEVERTYNLKLKEIRVEKETTREAEIEAKTTDEYYQMRKLDLLRRDTLEVIRMMKKIINRADEEKETNNF